MVVEIPLPSYTTKTMRTKFNSDNISFQALSALIARTRLAVGMGIQYGGDRDLYEALGYPLTIDYVDYYAKYTRLDIAKAVIDRPVNATWRGILELEETGKSEVTEFENEWVNLRDSLNLKKNFSRLDKLANLGRYAVLFLGFADAVSVEKYAMPVVKGSKLKYVRPFSEASAKIAAYEENSKNIRFGKPKFYDITFANLGNGQTQTLKVHYSRVIHVIEDQLESEVFGAPKLESIYNRLMDLEKIVGGDGEMFWRGARPGYTGKIDKDFGGGPQTEAELKAQFDEYDHNLRRFLVSEGLDLKALESQISDPKNHVEIQLQMISAVTGIPKRILTGSERGELSSEQDSEEYRAFVQERRDEKAEVNIVRPFVNAMIDYKVLPAPSTGRYTLAWPNVYDLNPKQKSEIGKNRADALRLYTTNSLSQIILPFESFMELGLGMTDQEIELAMQRRKKPFQDEESNIEKTMKFLNKITVPEKKEQSFENGGGTGSKGSGTRKPEIKN